MQTYFYLPIRCILFLALFLPAGLRAQETSGLLEGRIADEKGKPLADASIEALHVSSGTRYHALSDQSGLYHLPGLRIGGPYRLTVSFVGMVPEERDNIFVNLAGNGAIDFNLASDSGHLTAVLVKARRPSPRADYFGAGRNISRSEVNDMPGVSRSIQDLTRLVPQGSNDNSFAGTNFRYNNVTIDGAINNDAIGFSPSLGGITGSSGMPGSSTRNNPISLDAIEDMQVQLVPYDVRVGNFTGGSINAVTRSGTNETRGSLYVFGRNATLTGPDNAGDHSRMPSDFYEYQAGVRLGLPIVKNKLFFFTNEETTNRQEPILLAAGSPGAAAVIDLPTARSIKDYLRTHYGIDAGSYDNYPIYSKSNKFFNRLDWNIGSANQLAIRNNYIRSESTNLERDQQDFRFGSIDYVQHNTQNSTVAELKTRFSGQVANHLIIGYTYIHDYRTPKSDPYLPQIQISGLTPGTTIFLGTDREASIFNMRQSTLEITDNLSWFKGRHTINFGTHNELYAIQYGFVNSWNGRVDYQDDPTTGITGIQAFLSGQPTRVRGSYSYSNNDRNYQFDHPNARFHVNLFSVYGQDEIQVTDRLKLTAGLRADVAIVPHKQPLSQKTQNAITSPYWGNTYTYTPLARITNDYFGWQQIQFSPRIGFRWDIRNNGQWILRGGAGAFVSRIPFAWLGYAFYNNGDAYGSFDQKSVNQAFLSDPLRVSPNGVADFARANGQAVNNPYAGQTQVDVIDNGFKMPKIARFSLAMDWQDRHKFRYTLEGILSKTIRDVKFQQVNLTDYPAYYAYDSLAMRQPILPSKQVDPAFANAYELSNTSKGFTYNITARVEKQFAFGGRFSAAYTYGKAKDMSNGIRNSLESNWQLNQALNPNDPQLAYSNFDIRHRIVVTAGYDKSYGPWTTRVLLFLSSQSGSPFTWGFVNTSIQNTPQQVSLAYIPNRGETVRFFTDIVDKQGNMVQSASSQAAAFDAFIDQYSYLRSHRGRFTERNGDHTPWNTRADIRLVQDLQLKNKNVLEFSWDIVNLTNLLNKDWGYLYYSPNTFNSTASVGLIQYQPGMVVQDYPQYIFKNPVKPYSVDLMQSRWQMQFGMRYSF